MKDCGSRVETTSRVAQWRIHNLSSSAYRRSDPFKIGFWNWHLALEKNRVLLIKLYPDLSTQDPPIVSFVIRILSSDRKPLIHPEITDKLLKTKDDFVWPIDTPLTGKFIIDVEFLDLKTLSPHGSGEPCSILAEGLTLTQIRRSHTAALTCLARMLTEAIHTDTVINTSDGSVGAHRSILAARSPVFRNMFSHSLQEKELLLTINMSSEMSTACCRAFLSYLYGTIQPDEFLAHRLSLLGAADKYEISDLKEACQESLLEDIDAKNVLERLRKAAFYQLPELKSGCITYLVKFGKIFDVRDDFNVFLGCADRELITDIFQEILAIWNGF